MDTIEIKYTQHKNIEDNIRLYEKSGVYYLGIRLHDKPIYKSEYEEILSLIHDGFITWSENYDDFWNKYYNFRDTEKLEKVGRALYGESWQTAIARDLNVDYRRIKHWMQCTRPIPKGIWSELKVLLAQRKEEISKIQDNYGINAVEYLTMSKDELNKKANMEIFK